MNHGCHYANTRKTILLQTRGGSTLEIEITERTSVEDLKAEAELRVGIPVELIRLQVNKVNLEDSEKICERGHLQKATFVVAVNPLWEHFVDACLRKDNEEIVARIRLMHEFAHEDKLFFSSFIGARVGNSEFLFGILVEKKMDIKRTSKTGRNVLHMAVMSKCVNCIADILMHGGGDLIDMADRYNKTPFCLAKSGNADNTIISILSGYRMLRQKSVVDCNNSGKEEKRAKCWTFTSERDASMVKSCCKNDLSLDSSIKVLGLQMDKVKIGGSLRNPADEKCSHYRADNEEMRVKTEGDYEPEATHTHGSELDTSNDMKARDEQSTGTPEIKSARRQWLSPNKDISRSSEDILKGEDEGCESIASDGPDSDGLVEGNFRQEMFEKYGNASDALRREYTRTGDNSRHDTLQTLKEKEGKIAANKSNFCEDELVKNTQLQTEDKDVVEITVEHLTETSSKIAKSPKEDYEHVEYSPAEPQTEKTPQDVKLPIRGKQRSSSSFSEEIYSTHVVTEEVHHLPLWKSLSSEPEGHVVSRNVARSSLSPSGENTNDALPIIRRKSGLFSMDAMRSKTVSKEKTSDSDVGCGIVPRPPSGPRRHRKPRSRRPLSVGASLKDKDTIKKSLRKISSGGTSIHLTPPLRDGHITPPTPPSGGSSEYLYEEGRWHGRASIISQETAASFLSRPRSKSNPPSPESHEHLGAPLSRPRLPSYSSGEEDWNKAVTRMPPRRSRAVSVGNYSDTFTSKTRRPSLTYNEWLTEKKLQMQAEGTRHEEVKTSKRKLSKTITYEQWLEQKAAENQQRHSKHAPEESDQSEHRARKDSLPYAVWLQKKDEEALVREEQRIEAAIAQRKQARRQSGTKLRQILRRCSRDEKSRKSSF
ncbi:uncharacterized protein LOC116617390 [Nematostella vectensis]|uniref:uncharacterized protein LOC116617390 n=1 Tax=Nematostella vectensis TaxID=45351 RepID=UPI00139043C5|nr:uncharacterized protein LOC116617390 [Nematostella vectensis]